MPTILAVDDEDIPRELRAFVLKKSGYKVLEAGSGSEGLRLFRSEQIDLVVLDYWMSGKKGTDVAREMKALKPVVPIIMYSVFAELLGEGVGIADRWIVKGDVPGLLQTISTLLKDGHDGHGRR